MADFPELFGRIIVDAVEFDDRSIPLGLVGNDFSRFGGLEIDGDAQAALELCLAGVAFVHVNQRFFLIETFDRAVAGARDCLARSATGSAACPRECATVKVRETTSA